MTGKTRYKVSPKLGPTKVIIERSRGERFLWKRNSDLGRLGRVFFSCFYGQKKIVDGENIFGIE